MRKRFEGRVVVITGAAGGMGRTMARGFGNEGARLVLTDTERQGLEETAAIVTKDGAACTTHLVNLALEREIQDFGARICEEHARVDVLLNNAAIAYGEIHSSFETLSQEKWLRFVSVNMLAPLFLGQALRPALAKAGGVIINQSSVGSFMPAGAYGVTKTGLNSITMGMAHAFAKDGIRVNAVAPGMMETPASKSQLSPESYAQVQDMQLLKLHGTAQHIADLTLFLASDEGRFINCEVICCDAGNKLRSWRY
jgi:3-oxoacyl-[acyl-carrier protein] reductase